MERSHPLALPPSPRSFCDSSPRSPTLQSQSRQARVGGDHDCHLHRFAIVSMNDALERVCLDGV